MTEHGKSAMVAALGVAGVTLLTGLAALWTPGWVVVALASCAAGLSAWMLSSRTGREQQRAIVALAERLSELGQRHGSSGGRNGSTSSNGSGRVTSLAALDEHAAEVAGAVMTALVRLGEQLHALEDVVEAVDVPLLAVAFDGQVVLANKCACELLDRSAESVIGANLEDLFTEAAVLELMGKARQGRHASGPVRITRDLTVRMLETQASPVRLGGSRGVVLSFQDVTDLAMAVQLKTDFVGNASHELRTPIASIRAAVDTLLGPAREDAAMHARFVEMIRANVVRLEELVRDLLDLSRFESAEPVAERSEVDCVELCAHVGQVFEQACEERRITLSFEIAPALGRVWTDRSALELILRNLIENAIKFSHEGGEVRVTGTVVPGATGVRHGSVFEVIDQGIGIPVAHQARIFERFFQVDQARSGGAARRGTGLGLAIVKHAVRRLGGTVEVESIWKQGTTMTVVLPESIIGATEGDAAGPRHRREVG
jgi:two-component system phosphate regulon sensor histidine kinase PhoR